ncbi:MAG: hypothetical protein MK135_16335 [Polyangiaceae bacterium]|nr:hypothetical protein [Polyangiaceae bacterium]
MTCRPFPLEDGPDVACVRINTSTGDSKLVVASKVPAVASAVEAVETSRFSVFCEVTTERSSKLVCLRLDRETGAIARIPLKQLPRLYQ